LQDEQPLEAIAAKLKHTLERYKKKSKRRGLVVFQKPRKKQQPLDVRFRKTLLSIEEA